MNKRSIILLLLGIHPLLYAIGDGTKEHPFKTIEQALAVAGEGDTIRITSGKYIPSATSFDIKKGVVIIGGYDETFINTTPETTLLSGDVEGNDVYDETTGQLMAGYEDNRYRVVRVWSDATHVTIENIKIQGGYAATNGYDTGGGMMIQGNSVTLKKVTLSGNYCSAAGGGAIHVRTNLNMDNCKLTGNQGAGDGGALFINGEAIVNVTNTLFQYNRSTAGASVFLKNARSAYFSGNTFLDNHSGSYGTFTVYNTALLPERTVTLVNNTFAGNRVEGENAGGTNRGGSAVYVRIHTNGWVNLVNNTILANSCDARNEDGSIASQLGGAVFARQGQVKMANNVIAGNYSASGCGDVFKTGGVVYSLKHNLFGTNQGINIDPVAGDIFAGQDFESSILALTKTFDVSVWGNKLTGFAGMNGGSTPTIRVLDETSGGLNIKIIPFDRLQESAWDIDVDNDGNTLGYLQYDQRGILRNREGKACIGAYETGTASEIPVTEKQNLISVSGNRFKVNSESPFDYEIYDVTGKTVRSGKKQRPGTEVEVRNLFPGVYLIKVAAGNQTQIKKFFCK
ncbi:MAG: T9SS type A sorting domain-containing protein [Dysgonamonadaceae bacterium]|nr:T9SS type A sorting domain-containing protein [Dysgonamonadaceae bacterium]